MFFQTMSKKQIESVIENDLYDQLQFIVTTIMKGELPTHYGANHILYTANIRLAELKELASYHRKNINMYSSVGQFHKEAYEITIKHANQLELIVDSYISLAIDTNRERINHRLSLVREKVENLYKELMEFNKQKVLPQLQEEYWKAFKEDLMPLLADLR